MYADTKQPNEAVNTLNNSSNISINTYNQNHIDKNNTTLSKKINDSFKNRAIYGIYRYKSY